MNLRARLTYNCFLRCIYFYLYYFDYDLILVLTAISRINIFTNWPFENTYLNAHQDCLYVKKIYQLFRSVQFARYWKLCENTTSKIIWDNQLFGTTILVMFHHQVLMGYGHTTYINIRFLVSMCSLSREFKMSCFHLIFITLKYTHSRINDPYQLYCNWFVPGKQFSLKSHPVDDVD